MANEARTKQEEKRMGAAERAEITTAFREHAANRGKPPPANPTREEIERARAVPSTLSVLRAEGKPWIIEAVEAVYFVDPTEPLHKSDIETRITKFSMTRYVSRTTVYNWLAYARKICWAIIHHDDGRGG